MAKFGGKGNAKADDDVDGGGVAILLLLLLNDVVPPPGHAFLCGVATAASSLWSLIEKFVGGGDTGRLMVNDGEMGSQSEVSIRTASRRVVGVACVVKFTEGTSRRPADGRLAIAPRFIGARSLDNLLDVSRDLMPLPLVVVLFDSTSATVVVVVTVVLLRPCPPPGSISVWFFSLTVLNVAVIVVDWLGAATIV